MVVDAAAAATGQIAGQGAVIHGQRTCRGVVNGAAVAIVPITGLNRAVTEGQCPAVFNPTILEFQIREGDGHAAVDRENPLSVVAIDRQARARTVDGKIVGDGEASTAQQKSTESGLKHDSVVSSRGVIGVEDRLAQRTDTAVVEIGNRISHRLKRCVYNK